MPDGELISVTINDGVKKFSELGRHDNSNDDKSKYKKVCIGDIAYNSMRMWQGASGYSYYNGIVSPAYTVLSANYNVNSKFIAYQFKLPKMIHTFKINSQGITSDNWNLKFPVLSYIEIYISKQIEEQSKIAVFLESLDHLITLHQRKLEKLKIIKKSMLENLFPKNGEKTPRIRFSGFTEDWEQRKLGEVAAFSKGCGYSKSDLKDSGIPVILYGRLYTNYETVIKEVDTFVDCIGGAVYSKGGEIITPSSGETSEDISIASVVEKSGILLSGDLNIIYPQNLLDSIFIAISISNGKPHKDMAKRAQGKSIVHLHNGDLAQIEIDYPSIDEQTRISSYFHSLDHLITLHQRKLEKLKIIKKSMLENLFPKNGENTPRIRFSGFTEDWEQRKLGEVAIFNPKSGLPDVFEYVDLESVVGTEMLSHSTETVKSAPSRAQRLASKGDIFYQTVRPYQKNNYLFEKDDRNYVFSTGYAQMRPLMNGKFLFYLIQNDNFVKVVLDNCTGTSYPAINSNVLQCIDMYISISSNEQGKIGNIFQSLDHLITLHQLEPYYRIFKAIAYRIIDYAEYKFFNVKINLIYDIIRINIA